MNTNLIQKIETIFGLDKLICTGATERKTETQGDGVQAVTFTVGGNADTIRDSKDGGKTFRAAVTSPEGMSLLDKQVDALDLASEVLGAAAPGWEEKLGKKIDKEFPEYAQ